MKKKKKLKQPRTVRNNLWAKTNSTCWATNKAKIKIQLAVDMAALWFWAGGMLGVKLVSPVASHLWSDKTEVEIKSKIEITQKPFMSFPFKKKQKKSSHKAAQLPSVDEE